MMTAEVAFRQPGEPRRAERTVGGLQLCSTKSLPASQGGERADTGCGSGAWLSRLMDAGYSDLHGIDLDDTATSLCGIDFQKVDLESADWQLGADKFDLITAIEVIEHVGNRTSFLRNLYRHLSIDGLVLLTTPNVHNIASRLRFVLTDTLRQFDDRSDHTHYQPVFLHPFQLLVARRLSTAYLETYPPDGSLLQSRRICKYFLESVRALIPDRLPGEIVLMWLAKDRAGDAHQEKSPVVCRPSNGCARDLQNSLPGHSFAAAGA